MIRKLVLAAVAAALLAGCQSSNMGEKQTAGTVLGAVAGGLAGAQFGGGKGKLWTTGAGVLLGSLLGSELGASLDRADRLALQNNTRRALDPAQPLNQPIIWDNPNSGNRVVVTPTREGRLADTGSYCREYQQLITIGGRTEEAFGRACQQPDGTWKIVS